MQILTWMVLLLMGWTGGCQIVSSWGSALSTVSMHPSFIVTARAGSVIQGSVVVATNQRYSVLFYRPNEYFPNKPPFQSIDLIGNSTFASRPIDNTGFWRVEVIPYQRQSNYLVLVTITNGQITNNYVDVARTEKVFVTYFQSGENCGFNVSGIPYGLERVISISMYYGSQSLDFTRSQLIFQNAGMANNEYEVLCTARATGYYYIFVSASQSVMPLFPRILVNYQSDNYPCPASPKYKDSSQIFKTCVHLPTADAAYPCLNYDYDLGKCVSCQSAYTLQEGRCYLSLECGLDNYFHKGGCYPVIENCIDYQHVGGRCKQCANGLALSTNEFGQECWSATNSGTSQKSTNVGKVSLNSTNQNNGNSAIPQNPSTKVTIQCEAGTYLFNGLCALITENCEKYDQSQRICMRCRDTYILNRETLGCEPQRVQCPSGYTNIGNVCIVFPENCIQTNSWGNCTTCIINFTLNSNNKCERKLCGVRMYLSNGDCIPVNPKCNTYDIYKGTCTSCYNNEIIDSNGKCITPQYYSQQSYNGCPSRQYRIGNACFLVDSRCNTFDQYSGKCLTCIDPTQILDKSTGKCVRTDEICEERFYLDPVSRRCLQVSPYCDRYDPSSGYCLTCTYGLTLFRGGCIYASPCSRSQYRSQDGICVDADPNCDGVDQLTGVCLGCKAGYEINPGGVCCYAQNYLLTPKCTAYLSSNCQSQRAVFMNCEHCAVGYSLLNGAFGKCKRIGSD